MPRSADAPDHHNREANAFSQEELELAVLGLAIALGTAHVVCAELAACSRLQATGEPTYRRIARAAFLHAAARFLYQARVVLDPGVDVDDWRDPIVGLVIRPDATLAVVCQQPAVAIDERAVLVEAMNVLASETAALVTYASGPMAAVIRSVQACVEAAASQLQEVKLLARSADSDED